MPLYVRWCQVHVMRQPFAWRVEKPIAIFQEAHSIQMKEDFFDKEIRAGIPETFLFWDSEEVLMVSFRSGL